MAFRAFDRYKELVGISDVSFVEVEDQNSDYESGVAEIEEQHWRIRTARITPTKPGAFVAAWTRGIDGATRPFNLDEALSGLLVFVDDGSHFGVFRFTQERLLALGYLKSESSTGKRGFRVYPSWCNGLNPQAVRTQRVQSEAFEVLAAPTAEE